MRTYTLFMCYFMAEAMCGCGGFGLNYFWFDFDILRLIFLSKKCNNIIQRVVWTKQEKVVIFCDFATLDIILAVW